jgi:hypothetical protein
MGFLFLALVACAAIAQALPAPRQSELTPEWKLSGASQDYILATFPPTPFPSPELGEERACRVLAELPSFLREWRALSAAESHLTVEDHEKRVQVQQVRTDGRALRIRASTKVGSFVFDNGYDSVRVASRAGEVARLEDGKDFNADYRYFRWEIVPVLPEWPLLFRSEAEALDALSRTKKERVQRVGFVSYRGLPIAAEFPLVQGGRAHLEMIDGKPAHVGVERDALENLVVSPICTIVCPGVSSKTVVAFKSWEFLNDCPRPTWAQPVLNKPMQ